MSREGVRTERGVEGGREGVVRVCVKIRICEGMEMW